MKLLEKFRRRQCLRRETNCPDGSLEIILPCHSHAERHLSAVHGNIRDMPAHFLDAVDVMGRRAIAVDEGEMIPSIDRMGEILGQQRQLGGIGGDVSIDVPFVRVGQAQLQEDPAIPADRLLIETDTPYLTPGPHRGKPNEPSYLPAVAALLAKVRGVDVEELARQTTANAKKLFGW